MKIITIYFTYLVIGGYVSVEKHLIKRRIMFHILSNIICCVLMLDFFSKQLMPIIYDYGKYQCNNFMTNIITYVVNSQFDKNLKDEIIIECDDQIDINVSILNSISCNIIMKSKRLLYELEQGLVNENVLEMLGVDISEENVKRGIVFKIPIGRVLENVFLNNIGVMIPVRYNLMGELKGQIVSVVKEYGINNSLVEVNLEVTYKSKVSIPLISKEEENKISIPIVMRIIQGDVPDYLLGTNILGGE